MKMKLLRNWTLGTAITVLGVGTTAPGAEKPLPVLSPENLQKIEAAIPAVATAKPQKERRILVFSRCEGFVHGGGIVGAKKALELMGPKTGAFTADFSDDYAVFDPANLAKYDAIVLNNTTRLAFPDDLKKKALLDFVRNGKGLIGIHAATDNFYDWPDAAALIGGLFDGHPWGANGTWAMKLDEPDHVLNRAFGGKGFKLKDEIYQFKEPYTRADRRVLMTLDLSDPTTGGITQGVKRADKDFAIAWIKQEGKGRVFFCGLGHDANVFQESAILRFYLDGIQYALGDLAADATPKSAAK
jgi:type 1 glutamine amidotransferase